MKFKVFRLVVCCLLVILSNDFGSKAISKENEPTREEVVHKTPDHEDLITVNGGLSQKAPKGLNSRLDGSNLTYYLDSGHKVKIIGKTIIITPNSGNRIAKNSDIIRGRDETSMCPSEGFWDIKTKGKYFTIEQQNCSGWYFIAEFITFKFLESDDRFLLHKFGLQYLDRRDPEKEMVEKIYTMKHFGEVTFQEASLEALYKMNQ